MCRDSESILLTQYITFYLKWLEVVTRLDLRHDFIRERRSSHFTKALLMQNDLENWLRTVISSNNRSTLLPSLFSSSPHHHHHEYVSRIWLWQEANDTVCRLASVWRMCVRWQQKNHQRQHSNRTLIRRVRKTMLLKDNGDGQVQAWKR